MLGRRETMNKSEGLYLFGSEGSDLVKVEALSRSSGDEVKR